MAQRSKCSEEGASSSVELREQDPCTSGNDHPALVASQPDLLLCIERIQKIHDEQIDAMEKRIAKVRQVVRTSSKLRTASHLAECKRALKECLKDQVWLRIFCLIAYDAVRRISLERAGPNQTGSNAFSEEHLRTKRFVLDRLHHPDESGSCPEIEARICDLDEE
eukprot:3180694-Rhodomonas_salina.2